MTRNFATIGQPLVRVAFLLQKKQADEAYNRVDETKEEGMLKNINLQLLAEQTSDEDAPGTDEGNGTEQQEEGKTYTQEDVDNLINIQKAKLPPDEEWKEFKAWKAEQKKEADSKLDDETRERIAQTEADNRRLQAQVSALKAGVKPDAADDVITLAMAKVSDTVTIDQAIKSVIETYPQFATSTDKEPENKPPAIVIPQANTEKVKGMNQIMNDIIRGKRGN